MSRGRIQLLLGKSRWRRRRALPHDFLSGLDATGRPTFLYLTDTWRKRTVVEREFRDRACFSPPVRVLGELLHHLWLRHGDGTAILSARSEAILAERLLQGSGGRWPWLEALGRGRVGGEALAGLAAQLDEAGITRLPASARHAGELNDAVGALRERWRELPAHRPRAHAVRQLLPILERPPPELVDWLRRSHSVVIDDVLQPTPLRAAALIALCRAWAAAGAHVVVSLASGLDLGGREAGFFFEYDDEAGYPLKPFAATRRLRRTLFDAWIASGEAAIRVALADRVVDVEPGASLPSVGTPDLSDFVYGTGPLPAESAEECRGWLAGRVRLVRCSEPQQELRWIARSVRRAIDAGAVPEDCVVAWPDLEAEAAAVRAVFDDFAIPVSLGAGDPVAAQPAAAAVARLPGLVLDDWPVESLLDLADLCDWPLDVSPGELGRWCAAAGVERGSPASWQGPVAALLGRTRRGDQIGLLDRTLAELERRCEGLRALAQTERPEAWCRLLVDQAHEIGLAAAASASNDGLLAWGALLRGIDELVLDLSAVDPDPWAAADLREHLDRAVLAARWRRGTADPQRVQVVGILELRGLSPVHAWLGGLVRGHFPRPHRPSPVLEPALARQLQTVDPLAEARYLLHAALRNALDDPGERTLALSWSTTRQGRPLAPSPVLADLLALRTTTGATLEQQVVEEAEPVAPPLARSERERAALEDPRWLGCLDDPTAARLHRARALADARRGGSLAWSGQLDRPPPPPAALSVTALETLVRCPARHWYDRVLGLAQDDPWSPELEPQRRGTAVHAILQRFVASRCGRALAGEDRTAAAAELHQLAEQELDRVERAGGFEPALQAWARGRWLAGLVDDRPRGVLAMWLEAELSATDPLIPQAVEQSFDGLEIGGLRLRGQLDRLDRHRSGALLVTDYKTGSAPAAARVAEGLALQPLVYAEAAQRSAPEVPVAAAYLTLKRADDVRRRAWTGDPAALDSLTSPVERRHALALEPAERRELLERAAAAAHTALAGAFPTTELSPERAGCAWCPHARICRVGHADQVLDPGVL